MSRARAHCLIKNLQNVEDVSSENAIFVSFLIKNKTIRRQKNEDVSSKNAIFAILNEKPRFLPEGSED